MRRIVAAVSAGLCLIALSGCLGPQKRIVGRSVEGRPIETLSFGRGRDVVLLLATIHGDEASGTPLLNRMADVLRKSRHHLDGRRVVLVTVTNPDGYRYHTRTNVHGIDINRNFPAGNFTVADAHGNKPLSEPESRAIMTILEEEKPSRIVSIHQPLVCVDWDGPGEALAQSMGEYTSLPVKRLGSRPGSLGSYAGETLGIPIITLELPDSASDLSDDALWRAYGKVLLAAIRFPESVDESRE